MTTQSSGQSEHRLVEVDCYVRASAPQLVDAVVETLLDYEGERVSELSVVFWPECIRLNAPVESPVLDVYRRLEEWAENEGVSLEPGFEHRERSTFASQYSEPVLGLPVICLVVRIDGDIVAVAPHRTERSVYTVQDAIDDIEAQPQILNSLELSQIPPDHPARSVLNIGTEETRRW